MMHFTFSNILPLSKNTPDHSFTSTLGNKLHSFHLNCCCCCDSNSRTIESLGRMGEGIQDVSSWIEANDTLNHSCVCVWGEGCLFCFCNSKLLDLNQTTTFDGFGN